MREHPLSPPSPPPPPWGMVMLWIGPGMGTLSAIPELPVVLAKNTDF